MPRGLRTPLSALMGRQLVQLSASAFFSGLDGHPWAGEHCSRESVREATLLYQEDHLEVPVFSWLSAWSGGHRAKSLARVAGPWPYLRKHSCPTDVDRARHCPGHHSPRSDAEPDRLSTAGLCECGYCASKCPALWLHAPVTQRSGMLPAAHRSESVCAEHSFPRRSRRARANAAHARV